MQTRTAERLLLVNLGLLFVAGFFGNLVVPRPGVDTRGAPYLIWVVSMSAGAGLQVFISLPRFAELRERYGRRLYLADLLVCFGPILTPLHLPGAVGYPLVSSLLLFTGQVRWLLGALVLGAGAAADYVFWPADGMGKSHIGTVWYWFGDATNVCLIVYVVTRFAQVVAAMNATRQAATDTALAMERVRSGRDVHDLLGLGLTAIVLRLESVRRALAGSGTELPDAAEQLAEIRTLIDRTLLDLRRVSSGGPRLALAEEIRSAESVLSLAGITAEVSVESSCRCLPPATEADLARVVRETVTNVLRHSTATRCVITVRAARGTVLLEIANDGAGPSVMTSEADGAGGIGFGGTGLSGLSDRLAERGGTLAIRRQDGWFRVTATGGAVDRSNHRPLAESVWMIVPLMLLLDLTVWLTPSVWKADGPWNVVGEIVCTLAGLGTTVYLCTPGRWRGRLFWTVFVIEVATFVPYALGWPHFPIELFCATALVLFRGPVRWTVLAMYLYLALESAMTQYRAMGAWQGNGHGIAFAVIAMQDISSLLFVYYLLIQLARNIHNLARARAELARMTVDRERSRFGQDLRECLGSSLDAVDRAVDGASRFLAAADRADACAEITEALVLARRTVEEARAVARGRGPEHENLMSRT